MACFRTFWDIPEPKPQEMIVSELLDEEVVATD